jgi:hypothetical protein
MSKMGSNGPLGYLKHKLWPNEGSEVKLPIWFSTIKSRDSPWIPSCRWRATYHWKALDKGYNLALDLTLIRGLHIMLWAFEVAGVPILGISGLPLGSPRTKWHLGVGPMAMHSEYYKGEGGGFPQVRVMMSLVSPCLHVVRPCTKGVLTMH